MESSGEVDWDVNVRDEINVEEQITHAPEFSYNSLITNEKTVSSFFQANPRPFPSTSHAPYTVRPLRSYLLQKMWMEITVMKSRPVAEITTVNYAAVDVDDSSYGPINQSRRSFFQSDSIIVFSPFDFSVNIIAAPNLKAMAPPNEDDTNAQQINQNRPISTIVIIIAMQTEALPLVNSFQLTEDTNSLFPNGTPWVRYNGTYKGLNVNIIWPGKDAVLGVDSVGTVSASLVTYAAIQTLQPDLIINAGTAGGFKAKGACIGDVYVASEVAFHDRRIPIPVFDLYGVGLRSGCSTPNLVKELGFKVGKLSTGDSLDMTPHDEASILANDAVIKDMEGAAVGYVTDLLKVPALFVKAVTDIVDGDKPTSEEFLQNLSAVTVALGKAVTEVVDFISAGKSISQL